MSAINLSIIIPVYNNSLYTKQCLSNLNTLPDDHEIVLVDNNSTDDTEEIVSKYSRVKYIKNSTNEFFAKACNKGYKYSSGKYIMFLNNDIKVRGNFDTWTQEIIKYADNKIVGPTGGLLHSDFSFITETKKLIDSKYFYMSGWCITSSRQIWNKLILDGENGPWSSEFTFYFEDPDISYRARELGIGFQVVPIPVSHYGKMTAKKMDVNKLYNNAKIIFQKKWQERIKSIN